MKPLYLGFEAWHDLASASLSSLTLPQSSPLPMLNVPFTTGSPNPNPNFSSSGVRKRWPAVFLNKVFLACCHTHSSRVVYCCSCATRELRSHEREHMAQKAENIDYLKKCFIGIAFAWHVLQSTFLMSTFLILHVPA